MNTPKSINYKPTFSGEDLKRRIKNLSDAIGEALGPLQCWEDHEQSGANEIADNEAQYVQEIFGFFNLLELAQEKELSGSVKSVNKACWEIEMARQIGGIEVNHPWKEDAAGGRIYETHCSSFFAGFDYQDYGSTPEDHVLPEKSHREEVIQNNETYFSTSIVHSIPKVENDAKYREITNPPEDGTSLVEGVDNKVLSARNSKILKGDNTIKMDNFGKVSTSAQALREACLNFVETVETSLGAIAIVLDNDQKSIIYAAGDIRIEINCYISSIADTLKKPFTQLHGDAYEYLRTLKCSLDDEDERFYDSFWDRPESVEYLDENAFDDSFMEERLRHVRKHPFFENAITFDSDESFFEEFYRNNYMIRRLNENEEEFD